MLQKLFLLMWGTAHGRFAALLITSGVALLNHHWIILLIEALLSIALPDSSPMTIPAIIGGFLCIIGGIVIFVYFQARGSVQPQTEGVNLDIPSGTGFETALYLIGQKTGFTPKVVGFSNNEKNATLINRAELNNLSVEKMARSLKRYLPTSFPNYSVKLQNDDLMITKDTI